MVSEDIESLGEDEFFLSVSPIMQKLRAQAELLAQADVPVLILGETGSGKDTVARLIHKLSVYSGFRFLRVNCAEMPGDLLEIELFGREHASGNGSSAGAGRASLGKLEAGEKGTILLDEITEMPLGLQSRLLQVLQDKRFVRSGSDKPVEVDVRILAASSDNLDRAMAERRLRSDFYYRLSAFTVHVPPLRQRRDESQHSAALLHAQAGQTLRSPSARIHFVGAGCVPESFLAWESERTRNFRQTLPGGGGQRAHTERVRNKYAGQWQWLLQAGAEPRWGAARARRS